MIYVETLAHCCITESCFFSPMRRRLNPLCHSSGWISSGSHQHWRGKIIQAPWSVGHQMHCARCIQCNIDCCQNLRWYLRHLNLLPASYLQAPRSSTYPHLPCLHQISFAHHIRRVPPSQPFAHPLITLCVSFSATPLALCTPLLARAFQVLCCSIQSEVLSINPAITLFFFVFLLLRQT